MLGLNIKVTAINCEILMVVYCHCRPALALCALATTPNSPSIILKYYRAKHVDLVKMALAGLARLWGAKFP